MTTTTMNTTDALAALNAAANAYYTAYVAANTAANTAATKAALSALDAAAANLTDARVTYYAARDAATRSK